MFRDARCGNYGATVCGVLGDPVDCLHCAAAVWDAVTGYAAGRRLPTCGATMAGQRTCDKVSAEAKLMHLTSKMLLVHVNIFSTGKDAAGHVRMQG